MAKNDMEVIMYKILKYLYECMKSGKKAELKDFGWNSKLFNIPQEYWCDVIVILTTKGYIQGFDVIGGTKDGAQIQTKPPFKVTFEGRRFLEENSRMQVAKEYCSEAFNVLLSGVLGKII